MDNFQVGVFVIITLPVTIVNFAQEAIMEVPLAVRPTIAKCVLVQKEVLVYSFLMRLWFV